MVDALRDASSASAGAADELRGALRKFMASRLPADAPVDDLVQDGISAAHPFGALVAAPLLDAVGVLHVDPQLRVMPDDPRLGEFRAEFAGMLARL